MLNNLITRVSLGPISFLAFRLRPSLALLALFLGISALRALGVVLALGGRSTIPPGMPFFEQFTGALGVWVATPVVLAIVRSAPAPRKGWLRFILTYLGGFFVFSFAQILVMFALRGYLGPPLGLVGRPLVLWVQIAWELQQNLIVYGGLAAFIALLFAWEAQRDAQVAAAKLDADAAMARLQALTAKVDPHFLFNTLNTVSGVMFREPGLAERLLADLAEILRTTLDSDQVTWKLEDECAHAQRYVRILEARFGERLSVEWPSLVSEPTIQVPRFSLQSLIENAVKHNAHRARALLVRVRFSLDGARLRVVVEDDGEGFPETSRARGRGLDRLAEILELVYPGAGALEISRSELGGAKIEYWVTSQ